LTTQDFLNQLQQDTSKPDFDRYLKQLNFKKSSSSEELAVFDVPNKFIANWIKTKYIDQIQTTFNNINKSQCEIEIRVIGERKKTKNQILKDAQEEKDKVNTILNASYTFDSFIVGQSNQMAYNAALAVAKKGAMQYNPFFIYGGTGLGKTHLVQAIGNYCIELGKKVITDGRSIKTNIEIAEKAGLLKIKKDTIIPIEEINNYPADRIFILATGAQGEEFATLMRIATKKHKHISFTPRDTVILSSSVIPGNEISVQKLKDNIYRHDVHIIHYRVSDVHASGHGRIEELKWINKQVNAKYFMPAYGYHSMLRVHAQSIAENGFPKENIIVADNGMIIDVDDNKFMIHEGKAPTNIVMVDGFSVGELQEVVLRDRTMLSQDGMFVVVAIIDMKTGRVRKSPDIISRGFVYLRESQDLLRQARYITKKTIENTSIGMNPINFDPIKREITDSVGKFLFQQTAKRPIVLPVLIGV